MNLTKTFLAGALFAGVIFAVGPAFAEVAESDTDVHSAPGGDVIGSLSAGDEVTVTNRDGRWCQINNSGWVACRRLTGGGGDDNGGRDGPGGGGGGDDDANGRDGRNGDGGGSGGDDGDGDRRSGGGDDDGNGRDGRDGRNGRDGGRDVDVGISFGIQFGDDDFEDRPRRRGRGDRVCFYEHVNYEGDSFCMRPGERMRSLGRNWNDEISSIRVRGDAEALVCEDRRFRGRCAIVDRSIRNLGRRGNDIISSIRVR